MARIALILLVSLTWGCAGTTGDSTPVDGLLQHGDGAVWVAADGRTVVLQRRGEALLTLPPDGFVLGSVLERDPASAYDPYWLLRPDDPLAVPPPLDLAWETVERAEVIKSSADGAEVRLDMSGGIRTRLTLAAAADGRFTAEWTLEEVPADVAVVWMRLRARAGADEGFYGLGGWPDAVDHRGRIRSMQMEPDASVESFNNEIHVPIPLLIGTRGWGLFVESRRVGVFDVARQEADLVEITYATDEEHAEGLRFHLLWAEHPLDITAHYYALTGAPKLPAPWALGPWIWRDENRDQAQFLDDARTIRQLDLATSGMWIDRPYASGVNTFDFRPSQFPDAQAMINEAHALGFRMALWHTPYVGDDAEPYRGEARREDYFPTQSGALLNRWSEPIDFTNPQAFAWWQGLIRRYTAMGIEGFKLDYAEDVLPSLYGSRNVWRFADGSDERTMHHGYTVAYHRVYAETLPEDGGFLLCRAARWGDQVHGPVIWPGDLDATFTRFGETFTDRDGESVNGVGGLPASMIMGLNLGPSGFAFYGSDTGGYRHSPPDNELYIRWFQQTALSSVMQVGDSSSQPPWEFTTENGRNDATVALYRTYARLHLRLFPYAWTLAQRVVSTGRPIQRPLGLAHPELGEHPWDTYLFGDDLLVAPVMERGGTSREVLLPRGRWLDWWDGTVHDGGGRVTVPAPLEKLPLLLREGAVIPMLRPTIDTTAPATEPGVESYANQPGRLYVRAFPSAEMNAFELFDGTVIDAQRMEDRVVVSVAAGNTFDEGVMFEVVGQAEPTRVELDGVELARQDLESVEQAWMMTDETGGTVWIKVPGGDHSVVLHTR